MTTTRGARLPAARGVDALWRARPEFLSRRAWLVMLALDRLPWPRGEQIMASIFVAKTFFRPARLGSALRWARAYRKCRRAQWALVVQSAAHHGRVLARSAIIGLRDPDQLRPHIAVRGEKHLESATSGAVLLGFHVGMPMSDVVLRMAGYSLAWLGGWRSSLGWSRPAWQDVTSADAGLSLSEGQLSWAAVLLRARRTLLDGGVIYMTGDGRGREAYPLPVPGGVVVLRSGWLALRDRSGAAVLPVLSHLEDGTHVVTIHPALPSREEDPDGTASRAILCRLLAEHAWQYPEQCYTLIFRKG